MHALEGSLTICILGNFDKLNKTMWSWQGKITHVIVMANVIIEKNFLFVEGLIKARTHSFEDGNVIVLCIVEDIGPQNCACSFHRNGLLTTPPKNATQIGSHENQPAFK
jgi:histidine decarboxylase